MNNSEIKSGEDQLVVNVVHTQLEHFRNSDPPCRALELPEGIMLRYNLAESLYFYLRTMVSDGKISTRIYASDSPYDRQKTLIGEVKTPMFEVQADQKHLQELENLLRTWVDFIKDAPDATTDFTSFTVNNRAH